MRLIKKLLLLLPALFFFCSCSESDDTADGNAWVAKNQKYLNNIAAEARANASGDWKIFLANGLDTEKTWPDNYYVYCRVKASGTEPGSPRYNDMVSVNYSGSLIDGTIFDATYYGSELVPENETPVDLKLDECVPGFITALQEMVRGDIWEIYIPSTLGYGSTSTTKIPANSLLIFTLNLVDFVHNGETE